VDAVPKNYGENVIMLGAPSAAGVEALVSVKGTTGG
jgi:hypothetical protein